MNFNFLEKNKQTTKTTAKTWSNLKLNGILHNWESLCDIRPHCQHHVEASGTLNVMFDK